jgi:DNA-3-methyladenine glycosylase I
MGDPMEPDGRLRCWWPAGLSGADPLMVAYHDEEWGEPVSEDRALFELLALEGFQAGLSWATILRKREAFRRAFAGFVPKTVAAFDEADRERLIADAGIVRNRAKIDATIDNAGAFLHVAAEHGSFAGYLATFLPRPAPILTAARTWADVPATTPESDALSADLRRRGFRFVGSTIVYAFMQSVGLVDDHLPGCFRYRG